MHDMLAAYALDALSQEEVLKYERHLRTCADCRAGLVTLSAAAAELAFVAPPEAPPELLRPRILAAARADRPAPAKERRAVLPFAATGVALLTAAAAVAWAFSLQHELHHNRAVSAAARRAAAASEQVTGVLAQRGVHRIPLKDANGTLAVAPNGQAAILVSNLPPAGPGKTYEVWVINGDEPQPAGLLESGVGREKLALRRLVLPGTRVAVSIEPAGGVQHITGPELFGATNA